MHTPHRFATRRARRLRQRRAPQTAKTQAVLAARLRQALRDARVQSHVELAQRQQLTPRAIATLEHHTDMYVSNLRRCLEGMGGELEIVAHFPDGRVTITYFREIDATFLY